MRVPTISAACSSSSDMNQCWSMVFGEKRTQALGDFNERLRLVAMWVIPMTVP